MGVYINGINYTNLKSGAGLVVGTSPDQFGNISIDTLASGNGASTANPLSQFAPTTSAQLLATITNPTGTGLSVFGTSPALTTPSLTTPAIVTGLTASGAGVVDFSVGE